MTILNTTLCYIERDGRYLMLHRTKKEGDINKDKWIGVGGKVEFGESPEDCVQREVLEETGYTLKAQDFRGIVTFVYGDITEYMYLYTATEFSGEQIVCDEGELVWIEKEKVCDLPIWEGDKIFFRLLEERKVFFSLKLVYDIDGTLVRTVLDGKDIAK